MRTYDNALKYSKGHPTKLVEFKRIYPNVATYWTGFFLNRKREGLFEFYEDGILHLTVVYHSKTQHAEHKLFTCDGSIEGHHFRKNNLMHGECMYYNDEDGSVEEHCFYNSNTHVKELDYLINAERDDAFYVTLALCGIDSEYIFK